MNMMPCKVFKRYVECWSLAKLSINGALILSDNGELCHTFGIILNAKLIAQTLNFVVCNFSYRALLNLHSVVPTSLMEMSFNVVLQ